jgi:hypothetical protein
MPSADVPQRLRALPPKREAILPLRRLSTGLAMAAFVLACAQARADAAGSGV